MSKFSKITIHLLMLFLLCGCMSGNSSSPSFDEYGDQTSGILYVYKDGDGINYFVVTERLVHRYNSLIKNLTNTLKDYDLTLDVKPGYGVFEHPDNKNLYLMTPLALQLFGKLLSIEKVILSGVNNND